VTQIISFLASRRTESHADRHPTHAAIRSDCDSVGIAGEIAFGQFCGVCPDFSVGMKHGDGGVDFVVPLLYSVDVKTAATGLNLVHRQDKPLAADIYVLAESDGLDATLVGWAWKSQLERAEVRDLGHGIPVRFVPREMLRPMADLAARVWRATK
jgi:hypothetical protein